MGACGLSARCAAVAEGLACRGGGGNGKAEPVLASLPGLLANPRYFYFIWRRAAHTQTAARLARQDDVRHPARSIRSNSISGSSTLCNLRCKMCAPWGDTGTYFAYGTRSCNSSWTSRLSSGWCGAGAPRTALRGHGGGRNLLHPEIIDIFRMLKSYGLFVKPVTNGTLLTQYAQDIIASPASTPSMSRWMATARRTIRCASGPGPTTGPWKAYGALVEARAQADALRPSSRSPSPCPATTRPWPSRSSARTWPGRGSSTCWSSRPVPSGCPPPKGKAYNALVAQHLGVHGIQSWQGSGGLQAVWGGSAGHRRDLTGAQSEGIRLRHGGAKGARARPAAALHRLRLDSAAPTVLSPTWSPRSTATAMSIPAISSRMSRWRWAMSTRRPSSTSGLGNASRCSAACWRARAGSCRSATAAASSRKGSPRRRPQRNPGGPRLQGGAMGRRRVAQRRA